MAFVTLFFNTLTFSIMKKFVLTLAMLSVTAFAFVGCGEATEEVVSGDGDADDVAPTVEVTPVAPAAPAETPAE